MPMPAMIWKMMILDQTREAEIDEQPEAEGDDEHAEPDCWEVFAGFLDPDPGYGGGEAEGEGEGEEVDAREERGGAKHGLEVQGEVVGCCYEDVAVAEADAEGLAMLEGFLKSRRGMTGYRANFHSLRTKEIPTRMPKTMRQMTFAEPQG
jgi:hypothetical protein